MRKATRIGGLEIEQDLRFQAWEWRISKALWVLLLALIVAAALGLLGHGPLSHARAGAPGSPLWVEYEWVVRFGASVRFVVHARPQPDGVVRFTIGRSLLEAYRVQHVTPVPAVTTLVEDGVEYRFQTGLSGTAPIIFEMQPAARWSAAGEIRSPDGAVRVSQVVLP